MSPERPPLNEQAAARLVLSTYEHGRALWLFCASSPEGPDAAGAAYAAAALDLTAVRREALAAALDLDRAGVESPAWELIARSLDTWRPAVTLAELANVIRAAANAGAMLTARLGGDARPWHAAASSFAGAQPPAPGAESAKALCEAAAADAGKSNLAAAFGMPAKDLPAAGVGDAVIYARSLVDLVDAMEGPPGPDAAGAGGVTSEARLALALGAALDLAEVAPDLRAAPPPPALPGMRPPALDLALTVLAAVALDLPATGAASFALLVDDLADRWRAAGGGQDGGPPKPGAPPEDGGPRNGARRPARVPAGEVAAVWNLPRRPALTGAA